MNINLLKNFIEKNHLSIDITQEDNLSLQNSLEFLIFSVKKEADGEYAEALEMVRKAFENSEGNNICEFGAMVVGSLIHVRIEASKKTLQQFEAIENKMKSLDLIKLTTQQSYNFHFFLAIYFIARSTYSFYHGNYQDAIEFNLRSLDAWREIGEEDGENLVAIDLQFCYTRTGKFEEAIISSDDLFTRLDKKTDQLTYCHALLSRSEIFKLRGDYKICAVLLEESYDISGKLEMDFLIFHSSRFLADIYSKQGLLDKAEKLQLDALEYFDHGSNPHFKSLILNDIGNTARMRYDYELAEVYYVQSISHSKEIEIYDEIASSYYYLILNEVARNGNKPKLKDYLSALENSIDKIEDPRYKILPRLSEAIILSEHERLGPKFNAIEIFQEIITQIDIYADYRLTSAYFLIGLLIKEYRYARKDRVLEEILQTMNIMIQIALEMQSYKHLIDYYILMAKFHIELGKNEMIKHFLSEARNIADKSKVKDIIHYVDLEEKMINHEAQNMSLIKNKHYYETETFNSVATHIANLKDGKFAASQEIIVEPLIIMIISEGGMNLYSQEFTQTVSIDHNLVTSFLVAMLNFTQEVFVKPAQLEFMKLANQNLLLLPLENLFLCYIYKGHTGNAISQLNRFKKEIEIMEDEFNNLKSLIPIDYDENKLDEITKKVFLKNN